MTRHSDLDDEPTTPTDDPLAADADEEVNETDDEPTSADAEHEDAAVAEPEDTEEAEAAEPAPAPIRRPRARRSITGRDGAVNRPRRPRRVKREPATTEERVTHAEPSPAIQREVQHAVADAESPTGRRERPPRRERSRPDQEDRPEREERPEREDRGHEEERPARGPRREPDERPEPRPERPRRGREAARESGRDQRQRKRRVAVEDFTRDPQEVTIDMLDLIGCEADVHAEVGKEAYELEIDADDTSLLIGRHGQNLESLQYIVNRISNKGRSEPTPVVLDVAGYRQRRLETLEGLADSLADKAVRTRRPVSMEPLPPHERRIIHLVLRDDEEVETFSRGEGDERYLVIAPRRGGRR